VSLGRHSETRLETSGFYFTLECMIGPHQGKELELMLAGEKHLAAFTDAVPEDGIISEKIIPEKAFAPYVTAGKIIRICKEYNSPPHKIRSVFFTTPGNEWRAYAYFWLCQEASSKRRPFDDAHEFMIGRLLDYSEEDIQDFVKNLHLKKEPPAMAGGSL
jgi:hypothetical protein